ncbi:MAG: copper chaperone PCu(A)C [Rhodanobacteraceae bacterium]|nr:MAG: copper chaperone PCu(A)C [Rhodanobacteraceae bacterium]
MTGLLRTLLRAAACGCLIAASTAAFAAPPPGVRVEHAWIRWLPANLPSAGYAVIVNAGDATVRLTGAHSAAYGMVMLHRSMLANSDSRMERVDQLDIPAHGSVKLAPGGYHLMLSQVKRPIKPGDKVPMTLEFAGGATLQVFFSVLPANASGPAD